jgi:N-methylhydantoinase A
VSAEYGEYERFTTCVMNSYVKPVAGRYLDGTVAGVAELGIRAPLEVMQSNGGVVPAATAARFPVRLASSGPAAGVMGAAQLALRAGRGNIITFDMGGTSTDVSLVVAGEPAYVSEHDIEGLPIRAVGIDIRSIGAGGGSLARIDRTGALRVGPESAGADPGPACYGWGGVEPTVADADLALGYLDPVRFCDGRVPLDRDRARQALDQHVGRARGVSAEEAALGILQVCVTNMVGAVRNITMEQGHDPRDFSLVAFGGAGPVHAAFVAEELGIPEVLILRDPGLLSAKGMLLTNYRADVFRTTIATLDGVDWARLNASFQEMEAEARAQLVGEAAKGSHRTRRILGMCYEGQQNIVPVELPDFPLAARHMTEIAATLDDKFKAVYGFLPQNRRPQILHARVYVERLQDALKLLAKEARASGGAAAKPSGHRPMMFPNDGAGLRNVPVYDRDLLSPGAEIVGPAVIEEGYSNTVMGPGHSARIDGYGNIVIRIG